MTGSTPAGEPARDDLTPRVFRALFQDFDLHTARTTTSSTCASVIVRDTPGRGSPDNPSSRSRRKRARHLVTVSGVILDGHEGDALAGHEGAV